MDKILSHLKGLVSDGHNGTLSSKRVVTLSSFILVVVAFFANMVYGIKMDTHIIDSIVYIVMTGLGMTGLEKFASPVVNKITNVSTTN